MCSFFIWGRLGFQIPHLMIMIMMMIVMIDDEDDGYDKNEYDYDDWDCNLLMMLVSPVSTGGRSYSQ